MEQLTKLVYETCDLYLAAYLAAINCHYTTKQDLKTNRMYWQFDLTQVREKKMDYFSHKASIDAVTYADSIKCLKSMAMTGGKLEGKYSKEG